MRFPWVETIPSNGTPPMYGNRERWVTSVIPDNANTPRPDDGPWHIGLVHGEGIGPEVLDVCVRLLKAIESSTSHRFDLAEYDRTAPLRTGPREISPESVAFCRETFARGGAVLCGAVGGRFVYSLRTDLDLFCKIVPIVSPPELANAGILRPECASDIDIVVVRENTGGLYQGSGAIAGPEGERVATCEFGYTEPHIDRILEVAGRIALRRESRVSMILKDGGVPGISALWRDVGRRVSERLGFEVRAVNVDYAAYHMLVSPAEFDVVVAPNMFGDVIADLGGILVASRGITYSGNFTPVGEGVYQTSHGAALDLAGRDVANPVGQIYSLAMLLRESFGLVALAEAIEEAVAAVWECGTRTTDLREPGCRVVGTREMGELVAEELADRLKSSEHEACTSSR